MAAVAKEIFQVLQRFNYTVSLYDDDLNAVVEPSEARKFFAGVEDEKSKHPKPHLLISIKDDDDDSSIQLLFGKSVHANAINGLMQTARVTATKYNMTFDPQQYFKEIDPKDAGLAVAESKGYDMQVCEGMYGTSKSSYLKFENAKMIVRHKNRVDDSRIGARGRYVEAIFVENDAGERLKFPTNDLSAARAMTQHVSSGGDFRDSLGEQIVTLAEEYGRLGTCSRYVQANGATLQEGAMAVREACRTRMLELRKTFQRLYRPTTYANEAAEIDRARVLNETGMAIDEERLDELRRLLNDADLPHEVYETAARAMLAGQQAAPVKERVIVRPDHGLPLAENNPIIRSHLGWLEQFDPDRLVEFALSGANDYSYTENYDAATEDVIDNFDAATFVHSPAMQDVLNGRDPSDSAENMLSKAEVLDALQNYLRTTSDMNDLGGDLLSVAEQLLDPANEALRDMGYETELDETDETDTPIGADLTDDFAMPMSEDTGELTREDILLPPTAPNKSRDLFKQVGKSTNHTPDGDKPISPDDINKELSAGARGLL